MTIEDGDLRERLKLCRELCAKLELELEEARDLRDAVRRLTETFERVSGVSLKPKKKSPAERRAELDRLWRKPSA